MKTIYIATSINPFSKVEYQIFCTNRWSEIGYMPVCFQTQKEAEILISAGLDADFIQIIEDEETGADMYRIPSPRIRAVTNRLMRFDDLEAVILTNSDIYPNIRKPFDFMAMTGFDSAAMTRREIPIAELADNRDGEQYYGGLDIFYLSRAAVFEVNKHFDRDGASNWMAYGIPGWDYYLGALVVARLNGVILSGEDFLHVSHTPTYSNVNELRHYINSIVSMNVLPELPDHSPQYVGMAFEHMIRTECKKNETISGRISRAYRDYTNSFSEQYEKIVVHASPEISDDPEGLEKQDSLIPSDETPLDLIEFMYERGYLDSVDQGKVVGKYAGQSSHLSQVQNIFCQSKSKPIEFKQLLASTLFVLRSRIAFGNLELTSEYPPNSLHKVVLRQIVDTSVDFFALRLEIAKLFSGDMLQYSIVNKPALKSICLSCLNDEERELISKILEALKEVDHVQSA